MTINKIRNILKGVMYGSMAIMAAIIMLFESETLLPGAIEKGSQADFILVSLLEIITICTIPVALRLFKWNFVQSEIEADAAKGLLRWGLVRMLLICVPMIVNTLLYYVVSINTTFGYMAIIGLICLVFINPTKRRCMAETEKQQ